MLQKIIYFSIHNKLVIGLMTFALVIWGIFAIYQLPIDAVPDITNNQVQIITVSSTLAAQEIEKLITFPIELAVSNIPDLEELRSFSRFGLSVVTVVFKEDIDIYWARQQVNERLQQVQKEIPAGVGSPELAPVSTGLGEIYQYIIRAKKGYENQYNAMELRNIQDWIVRRQLLGTEGVADVSSFGGELKQYEIALNPDQLRSMEVSISEIFTALEKNNQNTGGAYIDKKPNAYFIRSEGLIGSMGDIEKIVVKNTANGSPLLIRDVAKVQLGSAVRYGAMTRNAEGEVTGAIVLMLKGANSSKVIEQVKEKIIQIEKTLPEGVEIKAFLDRTKLVQKAIATVETNLIEGALIVIFILVLFLGNLRAGLIVASVIPLAMLFAIGMMNVFGVSGNLMSLGAIDFGLIVDGAVIIVESVLHHLKKPILGVFEEQAFESFEAQKHSNPSIDEEVYDSSVKIMNSATFGVLIILIVYLPLLALVGTEGKMFRPMAQTVSFAILGAFILSLTYVPMMTALVLRKPKKYKQNISDKMMTFLQKIYRPTLIFALQKKAWVVGMALVFFVGSLLIFSQLGGEFIPTLDEGDFAVEVRLATGSSLQETIDFTLKASDILLKKFPEIKETIGKIGSAEIPTDPMPLEACDLMLILKDKSEWTSASSKDELAQKMTEELDKYVVGVNYSFQQPIQMRFNELMTGAKQDVVLKIFGEDLTTLSEYAQKVGKLVQKVAGVADLYVEEVTGLPQIVIQFNRNQLAQLGIAIEEANKVIRTALAGESAGVVFENERRYDLVVRLAVEKRQSLADIQNLIITTEKGQQVPLAQIADIGFKNSVNQIQRDEAKRRILVAFNVRGRDVESIITEIQKKVSQKIKFPAGYFITYGGSFKNLQDARNRLALAVPIALGLILILLYFNFQSIVQSLLIFTAIPLSAIGGILALWVRGMPFSISAGVGFIALFGVAVLNGIVLIAEFNSLSSKGETANTPLSEGRQLILKGTATRLRPVLMTALVASLGFLPMALSHGAGAEVQKPLATVVIGGLVSATLLTLLVLPCLYAYLQEGIKLPKLKYVGFGVLMGLLVLPNLMFAQDNAIPLEQAIQAALEKNKSIIAHNQAIEKQKTLQKTAVDLGKTRFSWQAGQYNSIRFDNSFSISQEIPFPNIFSKQKQLLEAQTKSTHLEKQITQNQLVKDVKSMYYHIWYLQALRKRLLSQDSIWKEFVKVVQLRYKTGEGTLLEQTLAENQWAELTNRIQQIAFDLKTYQTRLKILLCSELFLQIVDTPLVKRDLIISDSTQWQQNPFLAYFKQQIELNQKTTALEKAKRLPDIAFTYFNQSLIGTQNIKGQDRFFDASYRFQGFQIGVAIPLFSKPQNARVEASRIQEQYAQTEFEWQQKQMEGQYDAAIQQYFKAQNALEYYEKNILPSTDLIIKQANQTFKAGELNYVQFVQALQQVYQMQENYLFMIHQLNLAVIEIEFLMAI